MSYQVLARKWRPSTFSELVGQTHVLKALVNALDQQRLHHAYLFTGTRGVGKTTIARLLAKSLNCEEGVSAHPCGQCSACREIAEGRFVDLIEVDAASRTRVEDTRELLENVQYAPTRGRYKVYLIDEVHMLSVSSFNALLKTLEEPPPHVKFLLATTDPQKLPVTVLSRCLQFNLKNMTRESIVDYLGRILSDEAVPYEEAALWLLAEAAEGSMRDALSLTDQAIAFGEGRLKETEVAAMLGTVDLKRVLNLVRGLIEKDAPSLMHQVADVAEHAPDYGALMSELLSTLHRVAIAQAAPEALDNSKGDQAAIQALAEQAQPEDVHLFYQMGTAASREMALAPSERAGFEMALLRMLAFSPTPAKSLAALPPLSGQSGADELADPVTPQPDTGLEASTQQAAPAEPAETPPVEAATPKPPPADQAIDVAAAAEKEPAPEPAHQESTETPEPASNTVAVGAAEPPPEDGPTDNDAIIESGGETGESSHQAGADERPTNEPEPRNDSANTGADSASQPSTPVEPSAPGPKDALAAMSESTEPAASASEPSTPAPSAQTDKVADSQPMESAGRSRQGLSANGGGPEWPETDVTRDPKFWWQVTLHKLGLTGMSKTVFAHSECQGYAAGVLTLLISSNYRNVMNQTQLQRLQAVLPNELPDLERIEYDFGAAEQTPQLWQEQLRQAAWERAVSRLQEDRFVQTLQADFGAQLQTDTVEPTENPLPTGA